MHIHQTSLTRVVFSLVGILELSLPRPIVPLLSLELARVGRRKLGGRRLGARCHRLVLRLNRRLEPIIRRILAALGINQSLLALAEYCFCCCRVDCCRVVAQGFVEGFLMAELVLQDRDLPRYVVDEAANFLDKPIFSGN